MQVEWNSQKIHTEKSQTKTEKENKHFKGNQNTFE